jgi:hypothetical protein
LAQPPITMPMASAMNNHFLMPINPFIYVFFRKGWPMTNLSHHPNTCFS